MGCMPAETLFELAALLLGFVRVFALLFAVLLALLLPNLLSISKDPVRRWVKAAAAVGKRKRKFSFDSCLRCDPGVSS